MIRLAIVASGLAVRAGLRTLLQEDPEISLIAESADVDDLPVELSSVDVVVISSEAFNPQAFPQEVSSGPDLAAILLLTEDSQAARTLVRLPARSWGLLSPDASLEELLAAVKALNEGLVVSAPQFLDLPQFAVLTRADESHGLEFIEALTDREVEVLQLMAQGLANKQIAGELGISAHTVKFHISSIYGKLGANNRTEAVRLGLQAGLIVL